MFGKRFNADFVSIPKKLIIVHYRGASASPSVLKITGAGVIAHQSRILRRNTKLAPLV
jgi:hypothetical protein